MIRGFQYRQVLFGSNRKLTGITLLLFASALLFHVDTVKDWWTDDAFISFRYGNNLSVGDGLVFNRGERVEGYTNFLWTLSLAALHAGGIEFTTGALAISLASLMGVVLATRFIVRRLKSMGSEVSDWFGPWMLAGCGNVWVWTVGGGLETVFFTFLVTTALFVGFKAATRGVPRSLLMLTGILCASTTLTRPEGFLLTLYVFAWIVLSSKREDRLSTFGVLVGSYGVLILPYVFWKITYYDQILPNTFYAKVSLSESQLYDGLKYAVRFTVVYPLLIAFASLSLFRKIRSAFSVFAAGFCLLYSSYVILVGGDFMAAFRFFVPLMPLLCLLAAEGILSLAEPGLRVLTVALIVVFGLAQSRFHPDFKSNLMQDNTVRHGRIVGMWLKERFSPDQTIALPAAGAIPFFSGLRTIDMLGLTEPEIARYPAIEGRAEIAGHIRSNPRHILDQKPDIIMFGEGYGLAHPHLEVEEDIFSAPEFQTQYRLKEHRIGTEVLSLYHRIDSRGSLDAR